MAQGKGWDMFGSKEKEVKRKTQALRRKCPGNVGDIMTVGICLIAMAVVMLSYMNNVQLIQQKAHISQLARKYILQMETEGCLTSQEQLLLTNELQALGVTDIDYEGTTLNAETYGKPIALQIKGRIRGEYVFTERRVSTSKN